MGEPRWRTAVLTRVRDHTPRSHMARSRFRAVAVEGCAKMPRPATAVCTRAVVHAGQRHATTAKLALQCPEIYGSLRGAPVASLFRNRAACGVVNEAAGARWRPPALRRR